MEDTRVPDAYKLVRTSRKEKLPPVNPLLHQQTLTCVSDTISGMTSLPTERKAQVGKPFQRVHALPWDRSGGNESSVQLRFMILAAAWGWTPQGMSPTNASTDRAAQVTVRGSNHQTRQFTKRLRVSLLNLKFISVVLLSPPEFCWSALWNVEFVGAFPFW